MLNFSTSKIEAFHENFKTKCLLSEMGYTIQNLFLSELFWPNSLFTSIFGLGAENNNIKLVFLYLNIWTL